MSSSYIHVRDRALDQEPLSESHVIVKSGGNVTYNVVQPQTQTSNTSLVYNLQNVGNRSGRLREILANPQGTIVLSGNFTGYTAANLAGKIGWKAWPLNRVVDSVSHSLAGTAIEVYNNAQIIDWITKIKSTAKMVEAYDNMQQDICTTYDALVGTNLNPIGSWFDVPQGEGVYRPRTVGITWLVISGTAPNQTLSFNYNFWEPLITPYTVVTGADMQQQAIWNIGTESITLNLVNQMRDMVAFTDDLEAVITGISVQPQSCNIFPQYITARDLVISNDAVFQFPKFQVQNVSLGTVAPNTPVTATVSLNSNTMPSKFALYARAPYQTRTPNNPDQYLTLQSLQVQLSNGSVVLVGANQRLLYNISRRNGINQTWPVWSSQNLGSVSGQIGGTDAVGAGSVFYCDPVFDLNCWELQNLTTASEGEYSITFTATFVNNTGVPLTNQICYLYAVNDALLIRQDKVFITKFLSVNANELRSAISSNAANFVSMLEYHRAQYANSFLSGGSLTSFFKKVHGTAKKAHSFYNAHKDTIHGLANTAKDLYSSYKHGGARHHMADVNMYYA